MARPHIEFIQSQDIEETDAPAPFAGARERRLSTDDETGAFTSLMIFPAGWRADLAGSTRPVELFGLGGELRIGDDRVGPGCYVYLVSGLRKAVLSTVERSIALVMLEDEREPGATGTWEVQDTEQMNYANSHHVGEGDGKIPAGIVVKRLRTDSERGDMTWLAASAPNRITPLAEIHSTIEEAFLIRGDTLIGGHGEMRPGAYFWRPGLVKHGPMGNRNGSFFFFRTKEGGLDLRTADVPGWEETVKEYRSREPYYRG